MNNIALRRAGLGTLLMLAILIALLLKRFGIINVNGLFSYIDGAAYGWALFVLVYVLAALLALPLYPLTIAGGFMFGHLFGFTVSLLGSLFGAIGTFLISRHLFRDYFQAKIKNVRVLRWSKTGDQSRLWKSVLLTRLVPILPFSGISYGFGLTKITFPKYILASFFGMIPELLIFSFLGDSLRDIYSPRFILAIAILIVLGIYLYRKREEIREKLS